MRSHRVGAPLDVGDDAFPALSSLPLQVVDREISVLLRGDLPDVETAAETLRFWKEKLEAARENRGRKPPARRRSMARRADLLLRLAQDFQGRTDEGVNTQFICFGDVALVSCNVGLFCRDRRSDQKPVAVPGHVVFRVTRMAAWPTCPRPKSGLTAATKSRIPFGQGAAHALQRQVIETLRALRPHR